MTTRESDREPKVLGMKFKSNPIHMLPFLLLLLLEEEEKEEVRLLRRSLGPGSRVQAKLLQLIDNDHLRVIQ